jgi:hypothetical protein
LVGEIKCAPTWCISGLRGNLVFGLILGATFLCLCQLLSVASSLCGEYNFRDYTARRILLYFNLILSGIFTSSGALFSPAVYFERGNSGK